MQGSSETIAAYGQRVQLLADSLARQGNLQSEIQFVTWFSIGIKSLSSSRIDSIMQQRTLQEAIALAMHNQAQASEQQASDVRSLVTVCLFLSRGRMVSIYQLLL